MCLPLAAQPTPEDSLRTLLVQTSDPQKRVEICINLDNYCHYISFQGHPQTAYLLLNESIKAGNNPGMVQALRGLLMSVDRKDRVLTNDSVARYLNLAENHLTGEWRQCFISEINMRHVRSMVDWNDDEDRVTAEIMRMYTAPVKGEPDIYTRIQHEYAFGKLTSRMQSNWTESTRQCIRYYDNLLSLLKTLPLQYRANLLLCTYENFFTAYFNANDKQKAVDMLDFLYETFVAYKQLDYVRKERFEAYDDMYSMYYEGMARSPEIIGKERASLCLKKADSLCRRPGGYIESLYNTYKDYYYNTGDYRTALAYLDSQMVLMNEIGYVGLSALMSSVHKEKAECYEKLGEYQNALLHFLDYDSIRELSASDRMRQMRQEMGARYDVNRLEMDKLRLESRNRRIGLLAVLVVLVLAVAWGVTQRIGLKKLQRMQKRLIESNREVMRQSEKAQESERMKTAFINSMCHEVRTPLNSINGFSSLLADDSLDAETKKEFSALIQQNTDQLTNLLNDLLVISSLDSSDEQLPLEVVEVDTLLEQEMDKIVSHYKKTGIDYRLELEPGPLVVHTHGSYLSRILTNLLSNANKFTQTGSITLACRKGESGKSLIISVTDTGIGIPADKREWVFERFTKVDDYRPGIGMGLYLCRLIITRLRGSIAVDPNYEGGTRIVLVLPYE